MLDCKHKQHRHGRPQKFFQGKQSRHFGCPFQAADDTYANRRSHNALPLLYHKKWPTLTATVPKMRFVGSNVFFHTVYKTRWQQYFFSVFTSYVSFHTVTYCYQQSLPRCITCHRFLRSTVACSKGSTAVTLNLCWHVIVARWRLISKLSSPSYATCFCRQCSGFSKLQAHQSSLHDARTVNPALVQCECHTGKWNCHCKN